MVDLLGMTLEEIEEFIQGLGKERYRARQLFRWIYKKGVYNFGVMTDLSKSFREELARMARIWAPVEVHRAASEDGVVKFLFRLEDGAHIESVLIRDDDRRTVCLSSQVGCPLGCRFCATGRMGFARNLAAGEIVGQLLHIRKVLWEEGEDLTNVVLMGMGEPLLNYDQVLKVVRLIRHEMGIALGARRITLSTVGIVPGIERLAGEGIPLGLAISLNAPDDAIRSELMPINCEYPLRILLRAAKDFARTCKRRITFEYVLIHGVNDRLRDARQLADLLQGIPCKVNLIPYNPIPNAPFRRPPLDRALRFQEVLLSSHYTATLRDSRGRDIQAACGQLRTSIGSPKSI